MNYEQIFGERGGSYHRAMQLWPEARRDDFLVPLSWLAPEVGEVVVDVPAGGGYLQAYLPGGCHWAPHEPCGSFHDDGAAVTTELLPLPWPDAYADAAISIAGVHHLEDKRPLFAELQRVVKPSGRFLLADVHGDAPVARFLDEFVGAHNSTGHTGCYLGPHTSTELEHTGWSIVRAERVSFAWWFSDTDALAGYCQMLFDLRRTDTRAVLGAVKHYLGLQHRHGEVGMTWELYLVLARRRAQ